MRRKRRPIPFEEAERKGVQRGGGLVHISIPLSRVLQRFHEHAPDGEPKRLMADALDGAKRRALKELS